MSQSAAIAFVDGRLVTAAEAAVPALSGAVLHGRGVFTTVAVVSGRPVLLEQHIARICDHASRVGIASPNVPLLAEGLEAVIAANRILRGLIRISLLDTGAAFGDRPTDRVSIVVSSRRPRSLAEVLRVTVSDFPVNSSSPIAGIKTLNYLENRLALDAAGLKGFDEAVRLNEHGVVASGVMANVFWSKDGRLFTPPLRTGCLAGTTRDLVIASIGAADAEIDPAALCGSDSIFLTSAGIGIRQVTLPGHAPRPDDPLSDSLKCLSAEYFETGI